MVSPTNLFCVFITIAKRNDNIRIYFLKNTMYKQYNEMWYSCKLLSRFWRSLIYCFKKKKNYVIYLFIHKGSYNYFNVTLIRIVLGIYNTNLAFNIVELCVRFALKVCGCVFYVLELISKIYFFTVSNDLLIFKSYLFNMSMFNFLNKITFSDL